MVKGSGRRVDVTIPLLVAFLLVVLGVGLSPDVFAPGVVLRAGQTVDLGFGVPYVRIGFTVPTSIGRIVGGWVAPNRTLVMAVNASQHPETWYLTCSCGWPYNGTLDEDLAHGEYALYFFGSSAAVYRVRITETIRVLPN